MVAFLVAVILFCHGLAAGVMVSTVMGMVPLTLALPYGRYVEMIQFMWPRYDPFMPIMNGIALLGSVAMAVLGPGALVRGLFGLAAVLLVVVMVISVVKNVPVNRYVMSLDPEERPGDWPERDPRRYWRKWNTIRTALVVVAFAANLTAAAALLG